MNSMDGQKGQDNFKKYEGEPFSKSKMQVQGRKCDFLIKKCNF